MPLLLQRMQRFALGHRAVAHSPQASRAIHPAWVVVLASAWLATACNVPLWREVAALPGQGTLRGWGFALAFAVIVAAGNAALLSVLAWRWTLKPAITVMLLMAAFGAYFMLAYGIAIDASMLVNVMQTDVKEAGDLLNWRMPLRCWRSRPRRCCGCTAARCARCQPLRHMAHNGMLLVGSVVVIVVCLLLVFQDFASTMRNHTQLRYLINPAQQRVRAGQHCHQAAAAGHQHPHAPGPRRPAGRQLCRPAKPPLLVLVLGETGRSVNFRAQRLRTAHHAPAVGPHRPGIGAQRLVVRHQHGRIGALHVFAPGAQRLRGAQGQLRKPDRRAAPRGPGRAVGGQPGGLQGRVRPHPEVRTTAQKDPELCPTGGDCLDPIMLKDLDQRLADLPAEQRQPRHRGGAAPDGQPRPRLLQALGPGARSSSPNAPPPTLQECTQAGGERLRQQHRANRPVSRFSAQLALRAIR
jgi:lipid A ethanolaminephosphotransferase